MSEKIKRGIRTWLNINPSSLLYPANLQVDSVYDGYLFVRIKEIVNAAMQPFIFIQFRYGCLISTVNKTGLSSRSGRKR